ncbi:MAG: hypothetical protein ACSHX0_00020 [Akkermansiaceae bacterium]
MHFKPIIVQFAFILQFALAGFTFGNTQEEEMLVWHDDYIEALELAKASSKPLLIGFR